MLRDAERVFLHADVFVGDGEFTLESPVLDVGRRHFAEQAHQNISPVFDGGVDVVARSFNFAPNLAPDIQFPARVKTHLVKIRFTARAE